MRAGGYTVHQSLTAEAAAVLKMALALARGRGHAQVTPLHVAFTLLGSSSNACAYGLLRRACAKAHPGAAVSPSQCRALELCFNVALNWLPTAHVGSSSPSSSSSSSSSSAPCFAAASLVHQPSPTLSNALVAALKRAQANQRRGCVELQQPSLPAASQQQQPLLTIKVELDQMIVSILDDPSVSRVMREAGFSSSKVKASLEEDCSALLSLGTHSSTFSAPSTALLPSSQQLYLDHPFRGLLPPCKEDENVAAILDVMSRKGRRRRSNPAILSDSASAAEASVAALMRRLESGGGDVPAELRGAHVLRIHLSRVHVRLMARADVDAWASDLRRTVAACTTNTRNVSSSSALVIYVGDMRWAVDDDEDEAHQAATPPPRYSPAQHMAATLARLLGELRACWLVAAASYGTYMRCQRRALDATWAMQPVPVPAAGDGAGLGLSLGFELGPTNAAASASLKDSNVSKLAQFPLSDSGTKQEDGLAALCVECTRNFKREASAARAEAEGTNLALSCFPGWPQADEPRTSHTDDLTELKRKWSRLCQRVHLRHSQPARPFNSKCTDPQLCLTLESPTCHQTARKINHQDAKNALNLLLPNSAPMPKDEIHRRRSRDLDCNLAIEVELPFSDLKGKAESGRLQSEFKRRRGSGGLDLNVCAEEEEGGGNGNGSEDEPVPSELTNDGEGSSGDVADTVTPLTATIRLERE